MPNNPMRPLLISVASASLLLAAAPSFAQDTTMQANPRGSDAPAVAAPDPATANSPVAPSRPADPSYQGGSYVGAASPPPADAMNKTYPVCGHGVVDSCQNPGEGGAPGRDRASDYKGGPSAASTGSQMRYHHRRHRTA